jgi:F-type H+-transporting ATPase subunit gamma
LARNLRKKEKEKADKMPALIDLRRRIKSVRNTQQITQAMKTVSTAKFKKAQRDVLQARPYWHTFPSLIHRTLLWDALDQHPLLEERDEGRATLVIITSDKGLCGAFNSNLLTKAWEYCKEKSQTCDLKLVLMGKKAVTFFRRQSYFIERTYINKIHKIGDEDLRELALFLMQEYIYSKTDAVYVFYNEFRSILAPHITLIKLLPVEIHKKENKPVQAAEEVHHGLRPDWEPLRESLLNVLIPKYFETQIKHFFSESIAAEHAARMMAMENATKNAEDLIENLTLDLNKIRQASITKELLEIMTAVDALAKK